MWQCHEVSGQSGQTAVLAPLHQEQLILSPCYLCCVFRCVTPPPRHVAAISQLMQPSAQYRHSAACTSWPPRPPWPPWHPGPGQDQPGTSRGLQLQILQFIFLSPASTASTIECFYFDIKTTPSPCRERLLTPVYSVHSLYRLAFLLSSMFSEYCLFRCISMSKWNNSTGDSCTAALPSPSS